MAPTTTQPPPDAFFLNQVVNLTVWNGTGVAVRHIPLSTINKITHRATSVSISYGTQIGAMIIMFLVALLMTPRIKFARITTILNITSLAVGIVRVLLIALYYPSSALSFYNMFSGDFRFLDADVTRRSVAASVMPVPQTILIEAQLMLQAWSMMQLWEPMYKWSATVASMIIALVTVAFTLFPCVLQARFILDAGAEHIPHWTRNVELALITASICWFCFMFNIRLVTHMWEHRSFLPSSKGVSPMEVLVMTNGILMFVPVIFAVLEFPTFDNFEAGSWTWTSVIIVLPLGTLVAQRIAAPSAYNSLANTPRSRNTGTMASTAIGSDQPLFKSWSRIHSRGGSSGKDGVTSRVSSGHPHTHAGMGVDHIDAELARIENQDLEKGRVRVDREFEHREERL